jgi:opacity protein-like surface antigen
MQVFKKLLVFFFMLLSQAIVSQDAKDLEQKEQNFFVGFGPTLEYNETLYGINGRFYYGVNEAFCFGPEISYFPYQDVDHGLEKAIVDLNINAHYIFELTDKIGIYPLSGINYTIEKERLIDVTNESENEEAFGLNYGAGIHYKFNSFFVFSEFKGVLGQLNAEFISVGAIFEFNF